jgi:hypothetical protein
MKPMLSKRTVIPRILNLVLWLSFCAMAGTGLLLAFRLTPCPRGGRGLEALGFVRHQWGDFHTWISYVFIALILIHLAMHWRWLWQVASGKRRSPLLIGLTTGLLLFLLIVFVPVRHPGHAHPDRPAAGAP